MNDLHGETAMKVLFEDDPFFYEAYLNRISKQFEFDRLLFELAIPLMEKAAVLLFSLLTSLALFVRSIRCMYKLTSKGIKIALKCTQSSVFYDKYFDGTVRYLTVCYSNHCEFIVIH